MKYMNKHVMCLYILFGLILFICLYNNIAINHQLCKDGFRDYSVSKSSDIDVIPNDASGKLTSNQGFHYSPLTTSFGTTFSKVSNNSVITRPYDGIDTWTHSFNEGLRLYNKKGIIRDNLTKEQLVNMPTYPTTITATGLFYNTGPTPSNAPL